MTAYEHAAVYILLTNQPQYAGTICRFLNSLPAQLQKCIQCVETIIQILSRGSVASVNVNVLGHTLVRHVCLTMRLIITSPRCVHLYGGGYLILR